MTKKRSRKKKIIGIIANTSKKSALKVVSDLLGILKHYQLDYLLSNSLEDFEDQINFNIKTAGFVSDKNLCERSDIIISIGGDGTMLATAYYAQFYDKPVLGVNLGKLGFLVEADVSHLDKIIEEIKNETYEVEERMVITGECPGHKVETLYAINDLVIDKGGWPKMIEITITVGGEYVTTFSADGVIVATPTGSTGYSLSSGGPIVSPKSDVITISPISPHSLTVKPIVLPSDEQIMIRADSLHKEVQINCDGQRVFAFPPPLEVLVGKSSQPLKLIHTSGTSYFETLRNKLLWGIDLRRNSVINEDSNDK
ncbi:MAG: hypothetical protein Kow0098_21990 [Ignavibacteriaceae bacterium]